MGVSWSGSAVTDLNKKAMHEGDLLEEINKEDYNRLALAISRSCCQKEVVTHVVCNMNQIYIIIICIDNNNYHLCMALHSSLRFLVCIQRGSVSKTPAPVWR